MSFRLKAFQYRYFYMTAVLCTIQLKTIFNMRWTFCFALSDKIFRLMFRLLLLLFLYDVIQEKKKKPLQNFSFHFFPANKLKASHRPNVGTINPVHLSLYTLMVSRVEQHGVSECLCKAPFKRENRIGND